MRVKNSDKIESACQRAVATAKRAILPSTNAGGVFLDAVLAEQDDCDDDEQTSHDAGDEDDCRDVRRQTRRRRVRIFRRLSHSHNQHNSTMSTQCRHIVRPSVSPLTV